MHMYVYMAHLLWLNAHKLQFAVALVIYVLYTKCEAILKRNSTLTYMYTYIVSA
jgi:hypothetical protein